MSQEPVIKLDDKKLSFKGKGEQEQMTYEVELEFFEDVDPDVSFFGGSKFYTALFFPSISTFRSQTRSCHNHTPSLSHSIQASKQQLTPRNLSFIIYKKGKHGFWPRLLKDKSKPHFLKTDFAKWKDEDDEEEEAGAEGQDAFGGMDFSSIMNSAGGSAFGGGAPTGDDDEDNDDEEEGEIGFFFGGFLLFASS